MQLYDEAVVSSAKLDGGIYSLAMLAALNCGMYQLVPRIANRARSESVPLTEATYTILIQALAEAGGSDQAVQCLDQMETEGLQPNVITYAAAMAACKHRPQVVITLLERMEQAQVPPNTILLTTAIDSLAREGYADRALSILASMEQNGPEPNIYTYNTVRYSETNISSNTHHCLFSPHPLLTSPRLTSPIVFYPYYLPLMCLMII